MLNKWFLSIDFHPFFLLLAFPNFCKEVFITSKSDKLEKKVYAIDWNQPYLCLSLGSFTLQSILIIFSFFFFEIDISICFSSIFRLWELLSFYIYVFHLMLVPVILFFFGKYLFIRRLRSWKANNRLYRAQHGQALSLLLLCFVLQWSDDQNSPSARCNKPIKGTFTAHPRLVVGQIVGTFDLGEQRRLISPDTDLKIRDSLCAHLWDLELQWHLNIGCDGSDL